MTFQSVFQKLLKFFHGTIISIFFVPQASILPVTFILNLNETLLLLLTRKLVISPPTFTDDSSLQYFHKFLMFSNNYHLIIFNYKLALLHQLLTSLMQLVNEE